MFKTTERAADCEIRSVIRFLNAKNVLPSEIHRQICQVYGDDAMSDGMVRKWVRMFNEGRQNVHNETLAEASKLRMNICPKIIFQTAYHKSVTTVWLGLEVEFCRLHLGRFWWRNMQYLGLKKK